jgi:hypothetical protein
MGTVTTNATLRQTLTTVVKTLDVINPLILPIETPLLVYVIMKQLTFIYFMPQ